MAKGVTAKGTLSGYLMVAGLLVFGGMAASGHHPDIHAPKISLGGEGGASHRAPCITTFDPNRDCSEQWGTDSDTSTSDSERTTDITVTTAAGKVVKLACMELHTIPAVPDIDSARKAVLISTPLLNSAGVEIAYNQDGAPGVSAVLPYVKGNAETGYATPVNCITHDFYGGVPK